MIYTFPTLEKYLQDTQQLMKENRILKNECYRIFDKKCCTLVGNELINFCFLADHALERSVFTYFGILVCSQDRFKILLRQGFSLVVNRYLLHISNRP